MPSWSLLELNKPDKIQRPASSFPQWADIYLCDNCGADVTKRFRRRVGHSWPPYGREIFVCRCGATYPTGAKEWDNLGPRERHTRIRDTFSLTIMLLVVFSVVGLVAGLVAYAIFHNVRAAWWLGVSVAASPSLVLLMLDVWDILTSIMRTRSRHSTEIATR